MSDIKQDASGGAEPLTDLETTVQELTSEDAADVRGGLLPAVMPAGLLPAVQDGALNYKVLPGTLAPSANTFQK